jgi:hypothetical protein
MWKELEKEKHQMEAQERLMQQALEHKRRVDIERRGARGRQMAKVLYDELAVYHFQETQKGETPAAA